MSPIGGSFGPASPRQLATAPEPNRRRPAPSSSTPSAGHVGRTGRCCRPAGRTQGRARPRSRSPVVVNGRRHTLHPAPRRPTPRPRSSRPPGPPRSSPGDPYCWYALCRTQAQTGNLSEADRAVDRCGALAPGSRLAHLAAACVAEHRGDWDRALVELRAVLADNPSDDWVLEQIALVELVSGRGRESLGHLVSAGRSATNPSRRRRLASLVDRQAWARGVGVLTLCLTGLAVLVIALMAFAVEPLAGAVAVGAATAGTGWWVGGRRKATLAALPPLARADLSRRIRTFDRRWTTVFAVITVGAVMLAWPPEPDSLVQVAADHDSTAVPPVPVPAWPECTTITAYEPRSPNTLVPPIPTPPISVCSAPHPNPTAPSLERFAAEAARRWRVERLWYWLALIPLLAAAWSWRPIRTTDRADGSRRRSPLERDLA